MNYPHLDQAMSTAGAVFLAGANSVYLILILKYKGKNSSIVMDDHVIRMTPGAGK